MSKLRLALGSLLAGFLGAGAMGMLGDDPTSIGGWIVFVVGCYFFGIIVLLLAAIILMIAGCQVRWPGQDVGDRSDGERRSPPSAVARGAGGAHERGATVGRARVVRFDFKLREALAPNDPLSVPLLRLMAAVNDVRYVQKAVLIGIAKDQRLTTDAERVLHEGENVYLLRLLCGHLHEAGIAFRNLDDEHRDRLTALLEADTEAQAAVDRLRTVYRDASPSGVTKALLEGVRTPWAFHYKYEKFEEALEQHPERATTIEAEYEGIGRYTVTDDFARQYIVEKVGGEQALNRLFRDAIELAGTLSLMVSHVLAAIYDERRAPLDLSVSEDSVVLPEGVTPDLLGGNGAVDGTEQRSPGHN